MMPDRSRREIKFEIPFGTPPVKCRGCRSEIYFVPMKKRGVTMPVNLDGTSHFATCRVREVLLKHPRRLGLGLVFCGRTSDGRVSNGIREVFVDLLEEAGVKDFTFHDLRHTFASHLAMAGVNLYDVAKLLGHKDVKMTQRYAHLSPEYLAGTVDVLAQWRTGHQSVTGEAMAEEIPIK